MAGKSERDGRQSRLRGGLRNTRWLESLEFVPAVRSPWSGDIQVMIGSSLESHPYLRKSRGRRRDRPPAPFPSRMPIPWIMKLCVVDRQLPVGPENDTPSARPAAAINSHSKNAQEAKHRIVRKLQTCPCDTPLIGLREHKNTGPHASVPYNLPCTPYLKLRNTACDKRCTVPLRFLIILSCGAWGDIVRSSRERLKLHFAK